MTNYFLASHEANDLNVKKKWASTLAASYAAFARAYWTQEGTDQADPSEVLGAFTKACRGFSPNQQHDAHEAIVCMLDKLHDGLCRLKPGDLGVSHRADVRRKPWTDSLKGAFSVVSEVFRGQLETEVCAPGYTSVSHDHFTCLSLSIDDATSLHQCMQRHMAPETVDELKVDETRTVTAQLVKRFTHLPRVLIVHLKRFDGTGSKVDRYIDYTSELDLAEYAVPECDHHYALFGVCLHHGTSTDGHYSAMCEVKGQWYAMDDATVTPLGNINDIIRRDAYCLFYKRL